MTTPTTTLASIERGTVIYGQTRALDSMSLVVRERELLGITGRSGCGKSTLLHALAGLQGLDDGRVTLLSRDLADLTTSECSRLRLTHVGFVFQSADLVPELTLRDNIALPLDLARARRRDIARRVDELVDALGLQRCAHRYPAQASGGEAQRAAVGRALAPRPSLVLADEPTGALDSGNAATVLDLLVGQVRASGAALVVVTHDPGVAARMDRVVRMQDGREVSGAA